MLDGLLHVLGIVFVDVVVGSEQEPGGVTYYSIIRPFSRTVSFAFLNTGTQTSGQNLRLLSIKGAFKARCVKQKR